MPKRGTLRAQRGLKCESRQILPPRYIFSVLPSSSGSASSGAAVGYVTGISNSRSNSYLRRSWKYQTLPVHRVPVLLLSMVNHSLPARAERAKGRDAPHVSLARDYAPASLLTRWYSMSALYSSFTRAIHSAAPRQPRSVNAAGRLGPVLGERPRAHRRHPAGRPCSRAAAAFARCLLLSRQPCLRPGCSGGSCPRSHGF